MKAKLLIEAEFHDFNVADMAAEFIEDEIGQYDWLNNLRTVQTRLGPAGLLDAIAIWMEETGRTGDAHEIMQELDRLVQDHPKGRWQQHVKPVTPEVPTSERRQLRSPRPIAPGSPKAGSLARPVPRPTLSQRRAVAASGTAAQTLA